MSVHAVIPFKPVNPKTRLSSVLGRDEREEFAWAMLADVVEAIQASGAVPTILSTHPLAWSQVEIEVVAAGLNDALNACFAHHPEPLLLVMADLPLSSPDALRRVMDTTADIGIVPGRGGGTNVLFLKDPARFRADFYGVSYLKHRQIAAEFGCTVEVIDSFRLHTDIDEREDLVEVLLHNSGKSREFLVSRGFTLVTEHGRVGVKRHPHEQAL
ncbi:MAG: 2-phospho-L-lactate guanylyltransferase [Methanomicrobiales archaeon]|nr:2-phospho-L-lactate guanylyltransferase [Methanomicrobiales archaeon]